MTQTDFQLHVIAITNHSDSGKVEITWSDGEEMMLEHGFLREHCKCADCIAAEDVAHVFSASLRLNDIRQVGSYGVQLIFNDGHERGIYPWRYLHELGVDQEQSSAASK